MTNVVIVLADDLGFSDLGCYGGEIRTPHLDRLAEEGARLTRFYNSARCSPSRASLLTGLHPHQTGIGILTNDDSPTGYRGTLNHECLTLAEVLRAAGYATCLSGKWHLTNDVRTPNDAWPTRRGFQHFFGTLTGCGSYYDPGTLTRGEQNVEHEARRPDFFYTDAITDDAVTFVRDQATRQRPFFLYVAYTAPHWPLHAPSSDVAAYTGAYAEGWAAARGGRFRRQQQLGVADEDWQLSPAHPDVVEWTRVPDQAWQQRRMEVYAAMVTRMDEGVGRVRAALEEAGVLDDTLLIFLSDNGASAEELPLTADDQFRERSDIVRTRTRDGRAVTIGNDPATMPGPEDTYLSYGAAWANVSNTPFRLFKQWTHEGGIAAPFIVRWPGGGIDAGQLVRSAHQLTHVLPTVLDAVGVRHPGVHEDGHPVLPPEGPSMLGELRGRPAEAVPLFWEHVGNAAVRDGRWKLVRRWGEPWELYDVQRDPSELADVAADNPAVVDRLAAAWQQWADRVGVIDFSVTQRLYRDRGLGERDAIG